MDLWASHKQVHLASFLYAHPTADKPERVAEWAGQTYHKAGQAEYTVVRARALGTNCSESSWLQQNLIVHRSRWRWKARRRHKTDI